jgi:predicted dehydrogenase
MVFNYRFMEQTLLAGQVIRERQFGKLTQASLFVNFACWSHCIDLLLFFGGPVQLISAMGGEVPYKGAIDIAGSFRLLNGATGTILGTQGINFDSALYDIVLNFEKGSLRFNDLDVSLEVIAPGTRYRESHVLVGNHSRWDQYRASFQKSLEAYLDSIQRCEPPPVPALAGLEELQFEAALRRSISQKRPIDVQHEFPLDF